jgi:esterase/lipase superfamily enzyme
VGGDGLPAAGVVLDEDALLVAAVHVAGYEVQLFAVSRGVECQVADAGYVAALADGIHGPEAEDFGVAALFEEAVYAL